MYIHTVLHCFIIMVLVQYLSVCQNILFLLFIGSKDLCYRYSRFFKWNTLENQQSLNYETVHVVINNVVELLGNLTRH